MTELDLLPRFLPLSISGTNVDGSIIPGDYQHPRLAAELADALLDVRSAFELSDGTVYNNRRAILSLLRSLPETLHRAASFSSDGTQVVEALHAWERGLAVEYSPESSSPNRYGRFIRRLLKFRVEQGNPTSQSVTAWAGGECLNPPGYHRPLDEFSNAERIAIRDLCRDRIRDMERRLDIGRRLIAMGEDPRESGWNSVANVLWAIRHIGRTKVRMILRDLDAAIADGLLDRLPDDVTIDVPQVRGRCNAALRQLMTYVYPADLDLVAFRTLLQLETGAAPEEITALTLADIEWSDGFARVRLNKQRSRRSRTVRMKTSGAPSDSPAAWRAGDLLRRLLAATEDARNESEATGLPISSFVFITVKRLATGLLTPKVEHFVQRNFGTLINGLNPEISAPHDARRLRKTVKSMRAVVLRSVEMAAGDDHTVAVFQRHYAQSTTVHVLAGSAVNAAQSQVFDRIKAGPMFIKAKAASSHHHVDPRVASAAAAISRQSEIDAQLSVAQCADPFDSPFDQAGRLCAHRPTMCFACPNAIVFTDHLPRLLAYRDILRGHEREMSPTQFSTTHGQQWMNLNRILAEFTDGQLASAGEQPAPLHIPLSQRGTHE